MPYHMLLKGLRFYANSFRGFRREVWWLAAVTLINRAGTMVVPFLSLYLTEHLQFSLSHVAWVMTAFGAGSVVGSWLGGRLTDRLGFYPVIWLSLTLSGLLFIGLQWVQTIELFCATTFLLLSVSDAYRPALFVALASYSKPENRTRAVSLIRLAVNLGFSAGPAVGGAIALWAGYSWLFWIDGLTCLLAAVLFLTALAPKRAAVTSSSENTPGTASPYGDWVYWQFIAATVLISLAFLQYFSTVPLFYREVHQLSEQQIGLLLGLNGAIIFAVELPLIRFLERPTIGRRAVLVASAVFLALSFLLLNSGHWTGQLVLGMVLMTVGEMLNFPMMNRFAFDRAESRNGKRGAYMGLFTMAWSISHIAGHNIGLQCADRFGFANTWFVMAAVLCVAGLVLWRLPRAGS